MCIRDRSRELGIGSAPLKIGLILQGQDTNANSELLEGIKSCLLYTSRCV